MSASESPASSTDTGSKGIPPRVVVAGVLVVLAIIFIAENHQKVRIRLIGPVVEMRLWLALTILFVVGGICGYLLARRRAKRGQAK